ncbi:MAG: hypothetical protein JNJ41_18220 [Bacteroidia bacterium]|nr:hypothetical protein [Bacteroidia bacterium]
MAAEAAFFIKPEAVTVAPTSTTQGSGSHKITDLWLYVNGKFQGAYPTGNLMPIITKNEKVKVNILAGIKNNGISDTRISWIFYDFISLDTLVESGKTINRPLTFKYNPNTKFEWMEDFDGPGFTLVNSIGSAVSWSVAPISESFEGKSALIDMSGLSANAIAQMESSVTHTLPLASANVFLEINYKCNERFEVGVISGTTAKSTLFVSPTETWSKIYIQLADALNRTPTATAQKIYFKMVKNADIPNQKMFLDNIKVVYL